MNLKELWWGGKGQNAEVRDRDRWRAVVDAVMNAQVPLNGGTFFNYLMTCQSARNDPAPCSQ